MRRVSDKFVQNYKQQDWKNTDQTSSGGPRRSRPTNKQPTTPSSSSHHNNSISSINNNSISNINNNNNINNTISNANITGPKQAALAGSSSYYAGAKFLSPPLPASLPMPPEVWLQNRQS